MRKEVHQIKGRREVLEQPQELIKENGKDDNDELRNIAARFNRMDATLQKISGDSTARAAEEAKDEDEVIIGQQAKHADVLKLQEIMTCWKLYPNNEANNTAYLVETARSVAHLAEQVGRPEDGSSREKAEAPAEVAAGAASVEVAADAEEAIRKLQLKWLARHQWRWQLMRPAEK